MSALGQKRTYAPQKAMSALAPKADMCGARGDFRFGPEADIMAARQWWIEIAQRLTRTRRKQKPRRSGASLGTKEIGLTTAQI